SNSPILLQSYIDQYPNGTFVGLAKAMITSLQGGQPATKEQPKQQLAAVDTDQYQVTKQVTVDTRAITRALQGELRRHRCISARPDGIWGPKSRGALKRYGKHAGVSLASLEPSQEILDEVKARNAKACPLYCGARYKISGGKCVKKTCRRNQILTKKGRCIAKARTAKKKNWKKKKRRREVVEEEFIEEEIREPRRKKTMFDDEDELCPQCSSF
ncbi:MAG: hypothetical protein ACR2OM_06260, partial [Aestuariivirgaceae bacterium]